MTLFNKINDRNGSTRCDPLPTEDQLSQYYKEEFYQSLKPFQLNDSSLEVRDRDKDFYDIQYGIFAKLLDFNSSETLRHIDLACGYGHFLSYISSNFPGIQLTGCEVFDESAPYVRRISNASFERIDLNSFRNFNQFIGKSSSISLINALEHLRKPEEFLTACFDNMNSGSKMLIQVPNDFNPIQKASVDQLDLDEWWFCPPRHITYFNPSSLSLLCKNIGFSVSDLITTFPIDLFLLSGLNYRKDNTLGRKAHEMRLTFEINYTATHGLTGLIALYRNFAASSIGREIIISLVKP